ncbi:hypothetical protein [Arsenicicoccus dermatophilus]|uniref:hypothetical protein n=1 Tax=Arsenicicoccus dermatophilus TaxID=1076331 RepID=UPI001F4C740C|nr:hypothetical protein [Arsenicicoccus dermatophilus]MCH8612438.1 hypothetical protein [Arsenicicoccus dermatophilus]
MPSTSRLLRAALVAGAALLSACAAPVTAADERNGKTLVTYVGEVRDCRTTRVTGLVTQNPRGCFELDGSPLVLPHGTTWADDGTTVRLPGGAQLRSGAVVSGQVCSEAPLPERAGFDCGVGASDPTKGLVGPVDVQQ